jgi:hypothetical protein
MCCAARGEHAEQHCHDSGPNHIQSLGLPALTSYLAIVGCASVRQRAEDREACRGSTKLRQRLSPTRRGPDGAGNGCAMVAPLPMETSAAQPSKTPFAVRQPDPRRQQKRTPRVSGDQSGAREGQSTAGADTKEGLNTCNRQRFTRALPTVPHPASTVVGARALSTPSDS